MPGTVALTAVTMRDENNEVAQTLLEQGYRLAIHGDQVAPTREEHLALMKDAVGVIAGSEPYPRDVLEALPDLRVISRNGIGYDAIDLEAATDLGVIVTYVPDAMVDAVADVTLGLLIAAARRIPEFDAGMKRGEWPRQIAYDVSGRSLGLIGTGRIGMAVARRARAFRMRLIGFDPNPNPLFVESLGGDYLSLEELLEVADFVSLHVPATPGTNGMIGAEQLARMKPTAFLINAARGSLVDPAALLQALREGRLAGAALDVHEQEPPLPGSAAAELVQLTSVVALPHVASFTPVTVAKMGRAALANLMTVLNGSRPQHVANPEVFERGLRPESPSPLR
jgi:phosphoglycerate dehydrogenase-like enzyme